MTSSVSIYDVK